MRIFRNVIRKLDLGDRLLGNMLTGNEILRSGYGNKLGKKILRALYGSKNFLFRLILWLILKYRSIIRMNLE